MPEAPPPVDVHGPAPLLFDELPLPPLVPSQPTAPAVPAEPAAPATPLDAVTVLFLTDNAPADAARTPYALEPAPDAAPELIVNCCRFNAPAPVSATPVPAPVIVTVFEPAAPRNHVDEEYPPRILTPVPDEKVVAP